MSVEMDAAIKELSPVLKPGLSPEELTQAYQKIQKGKLDYEKVLLEGGNLGPLMTTVALGDHFREENRTKGHVLDVGAGTGLVAEELVKIGFTTIDGIEPADSMLNMAIQKKIYRHLYQFFITGEESQLPKDSYDALVTCGTFAENHLPVESLHEFIRLVRPGGVIVICTRLKYLQTVSAYRGRLEPLMTSLEAEGRWKLISRLIIPNYWFEDEGIVWTFSVI